MDWVPQVSPFLRDMGEAATKHGVGSRPGPPGGVVIRPWLQAFRWRTKTYSPEYIKVQVATAKEKGGIGFLFRNAANDYSKPYEAMPEMKAADAKSPSKDKVKYFRGDELPTTAVQASLLPAPKN